MSEFPYVEDIYDMETSKLEELMERIDRDVASQGKCQIPDRFESFEKYRKKALKLREHLELELEERGQFDDVLNFFLGGNSATTNSTTNSNRASQAATQASAALDFLDDDQFYRPIGPSDPKIDQKVEQKTNQIDQKEQINQQNSQFTVSDNQNGLTAEENEVLARIQRSIEENAAGQYGRQQNQNQFVEKEAYLKNETPEQMSQKLEPSDNFSQHAVSEMRIEDKSEKSSKPIGMFGGRAKMSKKELQNNMRAMLAKTKVADVVTAGTGAGQSAYQPKKHFQPTKASKQNEQQKQEKKNQRLSKYRQSHTSDNGDQKKEIVVNSQNSIYKPNLRKVESREKNERPTQGLKRGMSTQKLGSSYQDSVSQSRPTMTPSQSSTLNSKINTKKQSAQSQAKGNKKNNIYKPPTIPIYKKPAVEPKEKQSSRSSIAQLAQKQDKNQDDQIEDIGKGIKSQINADLPRGESVEQLDEGENESKQNINQLGVEPPVENKRDASTSSESDTGTQAWNEYDQIDSELAESTIQNQKTNKNNSCHQQEIKQCDIDHQSQQLIPEISEQNTQNHSINEQKSQNTKQIEDQQEQILTEQVPVADRDDEEEDEDEDVGGFDDYNQASLKNSLIEGNLVGDASNSIKKLNENTDDITKANISKFKTNNFEQEQDNNNQQSSQTQVEPPKLISKQKKKSQNINSKDDQETQIASQRTLHTDAAKAQNQDNQQPEDQFEQKIKEIEQKIKQRKEEQESKKKKNQLFDLLMKQHNLTEEEQEARAREQQADLEKIRAEIRQQKQQNEEVQVSETNKNSVFITDPKVQELQKYLVQPMITDSAKQGSGDATAQKKAKTAKKTAIKKRQYVEEDPNIRDYSGLFSSFYDIFVGHQTDPKNFDLNYAVRDSRNLYASFVNLMDSNAVAMRQKHKFDKAPLEMGYRDYGIFPNHLLLSMGKNLNDIELAVQNGTLSQMDPKERKQLLLEAACKQHSELQKRYQAQKGKNIEDIVKSAAKLTKGVQDSQSNVDVSESDRKSDVDPENQENSNQVLQKIIDKNREVTLFYRVVKTKTEVYDIISRAFARKPGWSELPHGLDLRNSWNFMWSWSKITIDLQKLLVFQKVNHFTGNKNVSRKDFLKRNIERAQNMSAKANQIFNIMPLTFILPKEYVGFLENFSEFEEQEGKLNYWIMKPAAKSRGRGINVVNDISSVIYGEPMIMQRYLKNPLLLNGYKFDLRIYVLVTSVNPLEIFIYKQGFGRFSTVPFNLDPNDKANKYIHLTNVSINKYNQKNMDGQNADDISGGTKVSLDTLKAKIESAYPVDWDRQIWEQIKDVSIKAMVASQNDIQYNPSCFEVYGFDMIIDSDFKVWLLEINSSPSLSRDTLLDDVIKQKLIDDTIQLLNPLDFDRKRLFEVLERRVHEDFSKGTASTNTHTKRQMNKDLTYILHGEVPRKYNEMPKYLGNYERIAPSDSSDRYLKLIGGQKMFGSIMKVSHKH